MEGLTGKSQEKLVEPPIGKAELVCSLFSTPEEETFFCQLSRYSNEELLAFNDRVNQLAIERLTSGLYQVKELRVGQIVMARFDEDGQWYRARIIDCDNKKRKAVVRFIDYGNFSLNKYDEILCFDLNLQEDVELLQTPTFGILCRYDGVNQLNEKQRELFFGKLVNRYLLIRPIEKETKKGVWQVEIPRLGYNQHMWESIDIAGTELNINNDTATKKKQSDQRIWHHCGLN